MIEFYETSYDMASKRNADMEPILFGHEDCCPSHAYGPTVRPYHLFHFITRGRGLLTIDGSTFQLGEGDAFLIPADLSSYYEASRDDPWSYFWMGITGIRSTQYVRQILDLVPERYVLRGIDTRPYAEAISRVSGLSGTNAANYFQAKLAMDDVFFHLTLDVPELLSARYSPSLATRAKAYLEARYSEKLSIHEVASVFAVHPNHLSRVFQNEYQCSPKQYLMGLKLEKARQMLTETDLPVTYIASLLGFEDHRAFSRSFKKYIGLPPSYFRKEQDI